NSSRSGVNRPVEVAGLDRGVRPIGDWSMSTTLSNRPRPSTERNGGGGCEAPLVPLAATADRVSLIGDDFREQDPPVTTVNSPLGMTRSTSLRLLPLAPSRRSSSLGFGAWRVAGISIRRLPDRYWPVSERGAARISS